MHALAGRDCNGAFGRRATKLRATDDPEMDADLRELAMLTASVSRSSVFSIWNLQFKTRNGGGENRVAPLARDVFPPLIPALMRNYDPRRPSR